LIYFPAISDALKRRSKDARTLRRSSYDSL
jgi:hypothetical protein